MKDFDFYQQENSVCSELQAKERAFKEVPLKVPLGEDLYAQYDPCVGSITLTRANAPESEPFVIISLDIWQLDALDKFRLKIAEVERNARPNV